MINDIQAGRKFQNIVKNPQLLFPLQKGISNEEVAVVNGRIECSFTREAFLDDDDETYYDLSENNTYTLIMAIGSSVTGDGKLNQAQLA